jgi:Tol biopolymer transport system component
VVIPDRLASALADRYRIERELGQGGMATVYLAEDVRHDRKVAVKVLRPELAAVIGGARFLAEIKTTANLQHPHILPLHDSGEVNGTVFYVMPFVEGESLRDRLTREKQLPVADAMRIASEVASALDYAHRHGVIHRDIKPENILLHDGRAQVADFGIALAVSRSEGGSRMTETGMSLGTPHYMSPEQAMGEPTLDARTDLYALGCVLYELLTGEPPFTGPTAQAIVAKVLSGEPAPVTALRRTVPPHVAAAVHIALQRLPADRFATAAEFASALGNPGFTTAVSVGPSIAAARGLRNNRPAQVLGAVALILAMLAGWAWLRPAPVLSVSRYAIRFAPGQELFEDLGIARVALSPNGRQLVYLGKNSRGSGSILYLRAADQLTATPIPGSEGGYNPAFSPDGSRLAFVSGSPRAIKVVPLTGGPANTITDSLVDRGGLSWGDDGYFYYDGHLSGDGIARVRVGGGSPEPVTLPVPGEAWHFQPAPLPGGKGVVFTVSYGGTGNQRIAVYDFAARKHTLLFPGVSPRPVGSKYLVYVSNTGVLMGVRFDMKRLRPLGEPVALDQGLAVRALGRADVAVSASGNLVYVSGVASAGDGELVWVDRTGKATAVDPKWTGDIGSIELSPDGRKVALSLLTDGGIHVWVKELDQGPASRLTFQGDRNITPSWSPDGRTIVFASNAGGGRPMLHTVAGDGSGMPVLLRTDTSSAATPLYTPDGKRVIYTIESDIRVTGLGQDSGSLPVVTGPSNEAYPALSPDGRWIAYSSDESGTFQIYVRPFPEAQRSKRQVSTEGGVQPRWSRDGRELFYISLSGQDLVSARIDASAGFAVRERTPLFSTAPLGLRTLQRVYDVSPDGRRFLFVRTGGAATPDELVLVQHFAEDLRIKMGAR